MFEDVDPAVADIGSYSRSNSKFLAELCQRIFTENCRGYAHPNVLTSKHSVTATKSIGGLLNSLITMQMGGHRKKMFKITAQAKQF